MTNPNANQQGTQMKDLSILIGMRSLGSQHGGQSRHPANVGCSYFSYTNKDKSNHTSERHQRKKLTGEVHKNVIQIILKAVQHKEDIRNG